MDSVAQVMQQMLRPSVKRLADRHAFCTGPEFVDFSGPVEELKVLLCPREFLLMPGTHLGKRSRQPSLQK